MKTITSLPIRLLLVLLALFITGNIHAQITMDEFMSKWENSRQYTLETVEKMPDNLLDYAPHPSARTFKEQITHVAASIAGLSKGFLLGGEMDFDPEATPQSKAALKKFIEQCYDYGKKTIASLSNTQMAEEIDSFAGRVTRRQMVGLIDDHATHHRSAAVTYIRANGLTPPAYKGL